MVLIADLHNCPNVQDNIMKWFPPGLHAADNAQVVLVTPDASLEVVEQVPQLHADDEARHAQEDVTPQLQTSTVIRSRTCRFLLAVISWSRCLSPQH